MSGNLWVKLSMPVINNAFIVASLILPDLILLTISKCLFDEFNMIDQKYDR